MSDSCSMLDIRQAGISEGAGSYFDPDLLIYTLLFVLDLFLELLERCTVGRGAIGLQNLDIPDKQSAGMSHVPSSYRAVPTHQSGE